MKHCISPGCFRLVCLATQPFMKPTPAALFAALVSGPLCAQTVTGYSRQPSPDYRLSNDRPSNYPMNYFGPRIEWARPGAAGPLGR